MFLRAEHGLRAVGVVWEEGIEHRLVHLAAVLGERHVLLLVHRLQFGMEAADDVVLEAVGLNLGPVLHLVAGDVFGVAGHVETGVGVGPVGTDGCHQLVIFVGDGVLGGFVAQAVDDVVDGRALGLVGGLAIDLELLLNLVEQGLFKCVVLGAELLGTFEHQVLEVVGQTGGLGGVVLSAYAHSDVGLDARSLFVDGHVDLQSVVQCVDTSLQRIVGDTLVAVLLRGAAAQQSSCQDDSCQLAKKWMFLHKQNFFKTI